MGQGNSASESSPTHAHKYSPARDSPQHKRRSLIIVPAVSPRSASNPRSELSRQSTSPRHTSSMPLSQSVEQKKALIRSTTNGQLNSLVAVWLAKLTISPASDIEKSAPTLFPNSIWFHIFRFMSYQRLLVVMRCSKAMFILGYHAHTSVSKRLFLNQFRQSPRVTSSLSQRIKGTERRTYSVL
jgi:hypothetical protein